MRPATPGRLVSATDRHVLALTIDRPPLNVLDLPLLAEIQQALTAAATDDGLCAVVLRGAGPRGFSAGVDVVDHRPEHARLMLRAVHDVVTALLNFPVPTIAAIHGFCLGGGLEIATTCDLVLAETGATLGQPEIKIGCFPPVACGRLADLIGPARAADMILTGEPISAERAFEIGLVSRLGPVDLTLEEVLGTIRAQSRAVLRPAIRALRRRTAAGIRAALLAAEETYTQALLGTADMTEGIEAFLAKRAPNWKHA